MLYWAYQWFVKITGYIPQKILVRSRIFYENKNIQSRKIKGEAIIASNHTSVFDFAIVMFLFPKRTIRCLMAELLFNKNIFLTIFLKLMGGIKVDRNAHDYSFINKCCKLLKKGWVIEIYPESRIPGPDEEKPLKFKTSAVFIALESGAPIIPIYNSGNYFKKGHNDVMIGTPIDAREFYDTSLSYTQNLENISEILRQKVICLGDELKKQTKKEESEKISVQSV